jgi:hypothetical protein
VALQLRDHDGSGGMNASKRLSLRENADTAKHSSAPAAVTDFLAKHLVLAALIASALWFYGGHQYLAKGKDTVGFSWQLIALLVLIAFCVNATLTKSWLSLAVAVVALIIEIRLIRRMWRLKR